MLIHKQIAADYKALLKVVFSKKLLLLHPKHRYANLLLAKLLLEESNPCFYYALQSADFRLKTFLEKLCAVLRQQSGHSDFGQGFGNLLDDSPYSAETLSEVAQRFAEALDKLSNVPYLLILDNFDLSNRANELQAFLLRLLAVLPDAVHIVLNSRELPALPWLELLALDQALIFLDGQVLVQNFHERKKQNQSKHKLEAFAFEKGRVLLQGKVVNDWEGNLPRQLFFFVLTRGQVSRGEILETLWPESDSESAVNVFHVTKRRLHKALGMDLLVHRDEYYVIDPELEISYDVMAFVEALVQARSNGTKAHDFWQQAVSLYRGAFLYGSHAPWIEASREAFAAAFTEANAALSG